MPATRAPRWRMLAARAPLLRRTGSRGRSTSSSRWPPRTGRGTQLPMVARGYLAVPAEDAAPIGSEDVYAPTVTGDEATVPAMLRDLERCFTFLLLNSLYSLVNSLMLLRRYGLSLLKMDIFVQD